MSDRINFRLASEERQTLEREALVEGVKLSKLVRRKLGLEADRSVGVGVEDRDQAAKLRARPVDAIPGVDSSAPRPRSSSEEQRSSNPQVSGSNPDGGIRQTKEFKQMVAQLMARMPKKDAEEAAMRRLRRGDA